MRSSFTIIILVFFGACSFIDEPVIAPAIPWDIAQPEDVGLNREELSALDQAIGLGAYGSIKSMIIVKDDRLVFENYYGAYNRSTVRRTFGLTIGITSMITGIALDEGVINDLDDPIRNYLPEFNAIFDFDPLKRDITIRNLLTMQTGIGWNESIRNFNDPANDANQMSRSNNWAAFVLGAQSDAQPGLRYGYNSGASVLLSRIIQNRTGQTLAEYASSRLFEPLQMEGWSWDGTTDGNTNAGWGFNANTLDLAKLGYVMANDGKWLNQQLISPEWIETSTTKTLAISSFNDFGFHWWRLSDANVLVSGLRENDVFYGIGIGGQLLVVVPHLKMVVALLSENFDQGTDVSGLDIVFNQIVPAISINRVNIN